MGKAYLFSWNMAYKVTMGKVAAHEAKGDQEGAAPNVTIQEARVKLADMNLVDQFLFDEVMEYRDAF